MYIGIYVYMYICIYVYMYISKIMKQKFSFLISSSLSKHYLYLKLVKQRF